MHLRLSDRVHKPPKHAHVQVQQIPHTAVVGLWRMPKELWHETLPLPGDCIATLPLPQFGTRSRDVVHVLILIISW